MGQSENTNKNKKELIFRDGIYLKGGTILQKQLKSKYTIVCMVLLIGPRVKGLCIEMLNKYSTRSLFNFDNNGGSSMHDINDTILVSCGTICNNNDDDFDNSSGGVILRLASHSIDIIGKNIICIN